MNPTYEKKTKDGKTAVLYSPGFGGGWSTWATWSPEQEHLEHAMIFDSRIVDKVLADNTESITDDWLAEIWGIDDEFYVTLGGIHQLAVRWVPAGSRFTIDEYDGSESVTIIDPDFGYVA